MFDKFTDKARKVMSLAQDEARSLGQMYVGTEHLLLALIKEGEGIAAQALASLDITYDETVETVREVTERSSEPVPGGHIHGDAENQAGRCPAQRAAHPAEDEQNEHRERPTD